MYTFVYLGTSSLTAERCCWSVCGWKLWGPRICRKSDAARSWESRAHGDLRCRTTPTAANVNTRGQNRTRKKQERYRIRPDQRRRVYVNRKGEREGEKRDGRTDGRADTTVYVWKEGRERKGKGDGERRSLAGLWVYGEGVVAVRVASGIHRSTFLSVATDRYGLCVCEWEECDAKRARLLQWFFSSGKAGP